MSTPNVPVYVRYIGNDDATEFSVTFPYIDKKYVKVYLAREGTKDAELLDETRYSFVNEKTIKFPVKDGDTNLGYNDTLIILRKTDLGSDYDFDNQRRLFPEDVMNADDLAFQQIQELAYEVSRAVKTNIVGEETADDLLNSIQESKNDAEAAAQEARNAILEGQVFVEQSRIWATGEDDEIETLAPGQDEHSSRGYADLAMAIANTPENVPVDASKLLALDVIRGPKGDTGVGGLNGDVSFEGSLNISGDDNHPMKVTSMAGTSASGYQVVDSLGAGESDFEHYANGDRYGTRISNKSTKTGKTVSIDLYQTTARRSVLDLSKPDTIIAPQLLDLIFPVGSYYLSEEAECPLSDWMDECQWEKIATNVGELTVNVFRRIM